MGGRADGDGPAALGRFGEGIGTAFQLVDDALDYAADPAKLGKRLGADLVEGKATLPLIRALAAEPALRERLAPSPTAPTPPTTSPRGHRRGEAHGRRRGGQGAGA